MINLELNTVNEFVLDLFPIRKTIGKDYYFEFRHDQQKKLFEIILMDLSPFEKSYQLFSLDLTTELQNMVFRGDYEVKVFDSATKENMVHIGKMKLTGVPRDNKTNVVATGNNKIHNDRSN